MNEVSHQQESTDRPWEDPDLLRQLYHDEGLSQRAIADRLNTSRSKVRRNLHDNDIKQRPSRREGVRRAGFSLNSGGYEIWRARYKDEEELAFVHQLVAIADGADPHKVYSDEYIVHHVISVPWLNFGDNLVVASKAGHAALHSLKVTDDELTSFVREKSGATSSDVSDKFDICRSRANARLKNLFDRGVLLRDRAASFRPYTYTTEHQSSDDDRDEPHAELAECPFCHALGLKERIEGEHFCKQMRAVNDR